ncbi:Triosephosphate isomerase [Apodospora peruviana]|uniref:Triosephosphate isomerase n=1 Tax=Apodospora peruviana TaxID=516989 RepID=A0AAE0I5Y4_9PEZI|nr:Triosephosphate isomerase [Apodospora peruviana]
MEPHKSNVDNHQGDEHLGQAQTSAAKSTPTTLQDDGTVQAPIRRRIVGVSTKMYFESQRTTDFVHSVLGMLGFPQLPEYDTANPTLSDVLSNIDVFIIPDFVSLKEVATHVRTRKWPYPPVPGKPNAERRLMVGAQDCHWQEFGAFTGQVSPLVLREAGCDLVELGHAERRRYFAETDETTAAKAAAVARNGMIPLVCVGEMTHPADDPHHVAEAAAEDVMKQVRPVLRAIPDEQEVVFAYEPVWAIGADEPASAAHVCAVVKRVRESPEIKDRRGLTRIVYGGSAGPGLFAKLAHEVDGLFLGRFAHDPKQFVKTMYEIAGLERTTAVAVAGPSG